jgi:hypothetical protein
MQTIYAQDLEQRKKALQEKRMRVLDGMLVRMLFIGILVWDYTETVLDIASQMKISETKKISRTIRALRTDYDARHYLHSGTNHNIDAELADEFETRNEKLFERLCNGLQAELKPYNLTPEYKMLVQAVYMALTAIDAMHLYAHDCDTYLHDMWGEMPRTILPSHFCKLATLLPQYAGDCYNPNSPTRAAIAKELHDSVTHTKFETSRNKNDDEISVVTDN